MPTTQEAALLKLQSFVDGATPPVKWTGTKLAGYAASGPYHCKDCKWLRGRKEGQIFRDAIGRGRCNHPAMMADPQVEHEEPPQIVSGTHRDIEKPRPAIVDIQFGCCTFVNNDIRQKA
jgi:hypothetical protein